MFNLFKKKEEKKPAEIIVPKREDDNDEQGTLLCPKCRVFMNKRVYKNVVMDVCAHCKSIFLDEGELQKIENLKDFKA